MRAEKAPQVILDKGEFVMSEIFDDWAERYDQWFETVMGRLIKAY